MNGNRTLRFERPPSAMGYMARALRPPAEGSGGLECPALQARWEGHRIEPRDLVGFSRLTGISTGLGVSVLYPQAFAFRLLMVIVTHPAFPLPVRTALQVRNHLVLRHPIPIDAPLDIEATVARHRVLQRGVEVDLQTTLRSETTLVWEGLTTFYYRGRSGADAPSRFARSPDVRGDVRAAWTTSRGAGWRFARLTGDYNGIHYWPWYARRLGFRSAFHHPQRSVGACLARLRGPAEAHPQRLDLWFKGPVYYASEVQLRASDEQAGTAFALHLAGDDRPAIVGRWQGGTDAGDPYRRVETDVDHSA